jgi:hypothetical protein
MFEILAREHAAIDHTTVLNTFNTSFANVSMQNDRLF